jgi:hypothetical protein
MAVMERLAFLGGGRVKVASFAPKMADRIEE